MKQNDWLYKNECYEVILKCARKTLTNDIARFKYGKAFSLHELVDIDPETKCQTGGAPKIDPEDLASSIWVALSKCKKDGDKLAMLFNFYDIDSDMPIESFAKDFQHVPDKLLDKVLNELSGKGDLPVLQLTQHLRNGNIDIFASIIRHHSSEYLFNEIMKKKTWNEINYIIKANLNREYIDKSRKQSSFESDVNNATYDAFRRCLKRFWENKTKSVNCGYLLYKVVYKDKIAKYTLFGFSFDPEIQYDIASINDIELLANTENSEDAAISIYSCFKDPTDEIEAGGILKHKQNSILQLAEFFWQSYLSLLGDNNPKLIPVNNLVQYADYYYDLDICLEYEGSLGKNGIKGDNDHNSLENIEQDLLKDDPPLSPEQITSQKYDLNTKDFVLAALPEVYRDILLKRYADEKVILQEISVNKGKSNSTVSTYEKDGIIAAQSIRSLAGFVGINTCNAALIGESAVRLAKSLDENSFVIQYRDKYSRALKEFAVLLDELPEQVHFRLRENVPLYAQCTNESLNNKGLSLNAQIVKGLNAVAGVNACKKSQIGESAIKLAKELDAKSCVVRNRNKLSHAINECATLLGVSADEVHAQLREMVPLYSQCTQNKFENI